MPLKLSEFDDAVALDGSELVGIVQDGGNAKTTAADIAALAIGDAANAELIRDTIGTALIAVGLVKTVDDGGDTITFAASRTVAFFFTTSPTASEELLIWTAPAGETVTFADEFAGAAGISIEPPAADPYVLIVKKDGASVGTISIATSGAVTFVTTGGTVVIIGGTNYLTIEAPVTPDATCSRSSFTLIGTVS